MGLSYVLLLIIWVFFVYEVPYTVWVKPPIMVYGSTPYVGMTPKKEPCQALSSASMANKTVNFAGKYR